MKKTLLIIGAGHESVPGIRKAKKMGLNVITSDYNINAPGMKISDSQLVSSTYDVKKTIELAKHFHNNNHPINGVVSVGVDVPLTVAGVAKELSLPGISIESASFFADKLAMKENLSRDKITVPWFSPVSSAEELQKIYSQVDFPLVIKPVDSRGSRGVLQIVNSNRLLWYFSAAQNASPTGRVMVEKYISGHQISTESIVVDGNSFTIGFADRNYEYLEKYSPHIIENGGEMPTRLGELERNDIQVIIGKAAESLGIHNGVIKGDIVITPDGPCIIEVAARLSGGYFCTHMIPVNTGVDLVSIAFQQALGEKIFIEDLKPFRNSAVVQRYFFPEPGKVKSIVIPTWVKEHKEIKFFEIRICENSLIKNVTSHADRAGVVITTGVNKQLALDLANNVISEVRISTKKVYK